MSLDHPDLTEGYPLPSPEELGYRFGDPETTPAPIQRKHVIAVLLVSFLSYLLSLFFEAL